MSFHWMHALWLLLVPVGLAWYDLSRRRGAAQSAHPKILRAEADSGHLELVPGTRSASASRRVRWRLILGLTLASIAVARPQWGRIDEPVFEQAREILIAIDLSRSMLAEDVKPSRLSRAKLLITSLLEQLAGERIGLVVFSGTAFLQSPLSADYEILREFLPSLDPDYLPAGGTDYEAMLETALTAFGANTDADRYLITLSDGESQTEGWRELIPELTEKGVRVISLGIGTPEGSMIPDGEGAFVKDERGAVVLSRLDTATLQELARQTDGVYVDASSWVDLAALVRSTVETGREGEFSEASQTRLAERFQWALAPALALLLWSFWREFPVHPRPRNVALQRRSPSSSSAPSRTAAVALLAAGCLCLPASGDAQSAQPPAEPLAAPLSGLVSQLAQRERLEAGDYAELARSTVTYGQRLQSGNQPIPPGAVRDGLDAVSAGEALDPAAADWSSLRSELEALLPPEEQEPPPPEEQESEEEQEQQDQQDPQSGKEGDPSDESEGQEGDPSEDDQSKSGQPQSGGQPGEQSQSGDNEPADEQPPEAGQSAFGEMDSTPKASPPPPAQGDNQRVGGQAERRNEALDHPELAVPLQKLDQLRNQDSPAKLFQLMQDPKGEPAQKGPDW